MELLSVPVAIPEGANIIIGQTHFIKTVEDLYEVMVTSVPQASFGLAFNEASGDCLIRTDGNDPALVQRAQECALAIGAGHIFVLLLRRLSDQRAEPDQGLPRGVPHLLRDGESAHRHRGTGGRGSGDPGRHRRGVAQRGGRRIREGVAADVPAEDWLQAMRAAGPTAGRPLVAR